MKAQHTPGPWEWADDHALVASDGQNVMGVSRSKAELKANRRLVKTAPELLEACKGALETAQDLGEDSGVEITKEALGWIKDAIAKATGQ